MVDLTLSGVSDDRRRLLLTGGDGTEYSVEITTALRHALRGEGNRPSNLESTMESTLRPRDIQMRIRAGESADAVAEAAGTTVDQIMAFVGPVLAERSNVAQLAQDSSVRRKPGENGARSLGEAVRAQLVPLNIDPDSVEWDAWRREDGRWSLAAHLDFAARSGDAAFIFDQRGSYVLPDNEHAQWLIGALQEDEDFVAPASLDDPDDELKRRRQTRPQSEQLELGDDTLTMVSTHSSMSAVTDEPVTEHDDDVPLPPARAPQPVDPDAELPVDTETDTMEVPATPDEDSTADDEQEEFPTPPPQPEGKPAAHKSKRRRASVPSWDEIMFGGSDTDS